MSRDDLGRIFRNAKITVKECTLHFKIHIKVPGFFFSSFCPSFLPSFLPLPLFLSCEDNKKSSAFREEVEEARKIYVVSGSEGAKNKADGLVLGQGHRVVQHCVWSTH